jgi:PBP1b-binding outer membrane lipoprotein LpoB
MIFNRITVAILATILSALLVAGCGGTSKADYEKEVQKVGTDVNAELDKLDSGTPTGDDFAKAQKALDSAVTKLEDIDPPSEVKDLHDDMVSALRDTSELFDRIAPLMKQATEDPASLGEDDVATMTAIQEDFGKLEERMTKVEKGFKKKKYDVGLGDEK